MRSRAQWIASILQQNNITSSSSSYSELERKLVIIFEKASIKVKEDYRRFSMQQAITPSLLTWMSIWALGYSINPDGVSTDATLAFAKFMVGVGITMITREVTDFSWQEENIIAAPFLKKTLFERLKRPADDTSNLSNEDWLENALEKLSAELPNLGCKTAFFKSAGAGLLNGALETQIPTPGAGVFIGTRGSAILTKILSR